MRSKVPSEIGWDVGKRVQKARELLVPDHVTEVISASELQRQYHDAELKRELCKSYDLFLLEKTLIDISNNLFGPYLFA